MKAESVAPAKPVKTPEDRRMRMVDRTMQLHRNQSHALIETLHAAQEAFGYLDENVLRHVAATLRVPLSRVYAVATFYHSFTLKPPGEHTCVICLGTACYIGGSGDIIGRIREKFGISAGETTTDAGSDTTTTTDGASTGGTGGEGGTGGAMFGGGPSTSMGGASSTTSSMTSTTGVSCPVGGSCTSECPCGTGEGAAARIMVLVISALAIALLTLANKLGRNTFGRIS